MTREVQPSAEKTKTDHYVIAFEDTELAEWLMQAIEERFGQFLTALAEAATIACPEDYFLVRPVLIALKRKYST
jgi:hypothetical protein